MTAHSLDFTNTIRDAATVRSLELTDAQIKSLNEKMQAEAEVIEWAGSVSFSIAEGRVGPGMYLDRELARLPTPDPVRKATPSTSAPATPEALSAPGGPPSKADLGAALKEGDITFAQIFANAHAAEVAAQIKGFSNPWKAGAGFSRTRQAIVTNHDPGQAARWKLEAGVR